MGNYVNPTYGKVSEFGRILKVYKNGACTVKNEFRFSNPMNSKLKIKIKNKILLKIAIKHLISKQKYQRNILFINKILKNSIFNFKFRYFPHMFPLSNA